MPNKTKLVAFWVEPKVKKAIENLAWTRRQKISDLLRETMRKELKNVKEKT